VDVTDLDADPLRQLAAWLDAARAAGQPMPEAMTIASATSDGVPSARLVVLRGLRRGLVFFTDCQSDKGAELAANPRAAAVLHWLVPAHRQVRVAGPAEPVNEDEADEYWSTRPSAVRLSAAASQQSRVIASRTVLDTQVQDVLRRHPGGADIPRPRRWGGFRVLPSRVEFWQESPDGLHDRIRYRRAGSSWIIERLSPYRSTASATRRSSPSSRPARHLLSQYDKREARRCAGKRSKTMLNRKSGPSESPT
jgi:pyridoxamine 5'-phosphate oxidase